MFDKRERMYGKIRKEFIMYSGSLYTRNVKNIGRSRTVMLPLLFNLYAKLEIKIVYEFSNACCNNWHT